MKLDRMNRKNFTVAIVGGFVGANLLLLASWLVEQLAGPDSLLASITGITIILVALYLAAIWLSAIIRRLHDIGVTGWLSIIFWVTPVILVLAFIPGTSGTNKYGKQPAERVNLRSILLWE